MGDRQQNRQDHFQEAQDNRQGWADNVREERQEYAEKYYDEYWNWHHGYMGSAYYAPHVFVSLGCSNQVVVVSAHSYYYCGGSYYDRVIVQSEVKYVPVSAPSGAEITKLENPTEIVIDGKTYYLDNGSFYIQVTRDGKQIYVVVDPPVGAEVPSLPDGARELDVAGDSYYQFDKVFYRKLGDRYVIVDPPKPKS